MRPHCRPAACKSAMQSRTAANAIHGWHREVLTMWQQQGDAFQTPLTPQPSKPQHSTEASVADLSPLGALPHQGSSRLQGAAPQVQPSGTPPWQANPVAQTQAVAASQLPADLERPNLLSSSSHVQVHAASSLSRTISVPHHCLCFGKQKL